MVRTFRGCLSKGSATLLLVIATGELGCTVRPQPSKGGPTTLTLATTAPVGSLAKLTESTFDPDVEAWVVPPVGWRLDPPKVTPQHFHKTWISPSGNTAYGVIRFRLPLPVGEDIALWGILREMKRSEGESTLLDKQDDPLLPGLRFMAEGGRYRVRAALTTRGFRGWCTYAGSLRAKVEQPEELIEAAAARDKTEFGPTRSGATSGTTKEQK